MESKMKELNKGKPLVRLLPLVALLWLFWAVGAQALIITGPAGGMIEGNIDNKPSGVNWTGDYPPSKDVAIYYLTKAGNYTVKNDGNNYWDLYGSFIYVTASDVNVTLSGVKVNHQYTNFDRNDTPVIGVKKGCSATLILDGHSDLRGGLSMSAISVPGGATLTIKGDGSLYARGGQGAPAIGGSADPQRQLEGEAVTCGTINIQGGSIVCQSGNPVDSAAIGGRTDVTAVNISGGYVRVQSDVANLPGGIGFGGGRGFGSGSKLTITGGMVDSNPFSDINASNRDDYRSYKMHVLGSGDTFSYNGINVSLTGTEYGMRTIDFILPVQNPPEISIAYDGKDYTYKKGSEIDYLYLAKTADPGLGPTIDVVMGKTPSEMVEGDFFPLSGTNCTDWLFNWTSTDYAAQKVENISQTPPLRARAFPKCDYPAYTYDTLWVPLTIRMLPAPPTASPASGTVLNQEGGTVTLSSALSGAAIYYTTDGTDPTTGSARCPSGGISVTKNTGIRAIAVLEDRVSAVAAFDYKVSAPDIAWPTPGTITYERTLSASGLPAGNETRGTFAWANGIGDEVPAVDNAGYQAIFTPNAEALQDYDYAENALRKTLAVPVLRRNLTITPAANQKKVYGEAEPRFAFSSSSAPNRAFEGALGRESGSDVRDDYAYTIGTLSAGNNYTLTLTADNAPKFAITPRPVTVSGITAKGKIYDGRLTATLDFTELAFGNIADGEDLTATAAGAFVNANAGTKKKVTVSNLSLGDGRKGKASNYALAAAGQQSETTADIAAKPITVTPTKGQSMRYGSAKAPAVAYTGETLIDGDSFSGALALEGAKSGSGHWTKGDHPIALGSLQAGRDGVQNYSITVADETFAVNPLTLTHDVTFNRAKIYDGTAQVENVRGGLTNLISGDAVTLSLALAYDSRHAADAAVIDAAAWGLLGADADNYILPAFAAVTEGVAISQRPLDVAVNDQADAAYGVSVTPAYSFTPALCHAEDAFSGGLAIDGEKSASGHWTAGSHAIKQGTLSAGPDYAIRFTGSSFTVTRRTLTHNVSFDTDKVYDGTTDVPNVAGGLTNAEKDDRLVLTRAFAYNDANVKTAAVIDDSEWAISGADAGNYTLPGFEAVKASIAPRTAQLVWHDFEGLIFSGDPQNVTATVGNLIDGDRCAVTVQGGAEKSAGPHEARATALDNANYRLPEDTLRPYTIGKATARVKAHDKSKVRGGDDPDLTAEVRGAASGDTLNYRLSREAGEDVGSYRITVIPGSNPDYTLETEAGVFTIYPIAPSIAVKALPNGTQGQPYEAALRYDGDEASWRVQGLPEGLTLGNGVLSGTPARPGAWTVTLEISNGGGRDARQFELIIYPADKEKELALNAEYLLLTADGSARLTVENADYAGLPAVWRAEGESVRVDARGLVRTVKPGLSEVRCLVDVGGKVYEAVCRVDVTETLDNVSGAVLETKELTVPVYKADGAALDIALTIPENLPGAKSVSGPAGAVREAAFVGEKAAAEYTIEIVDDRSYIVRAAEKAKRRASGIRLTLTDGSTIETDKLTLIPSKKLPAVKGTLLLENGEGVLKLTGAEVERVTVKKKPDWLDFDAGSLGGRLTGVYKKGKKLTAEVTLSGWTKAITVKAPITKKAPAADEPRLSEKSVTLFANDIHATATVRIVSAALIEKVSCASDKFTVADMGEGRLEIAFKDGKIPKSGDTIKLKAYLQGRKKPLTFSLRVKIAR